MTANIKDNINSTNLSETNLGLLVYEFVDNKFVQSKTQQINIDSLVILPFSQRKLLYESSCPGLNWYKHINIDIENGLHETKIDFFHDHYLCVLQLKNIEKQSINEAVMILKNEHNHVILYDESQFDAAHYINLINISFSKLQTIAHANSLLIYALIRSDIERDRSELVILENNVVELESNLSSSSKDSIRLQILALRKKLSGIKRHYEAITDVLEDVSENPFNDFQEYILNDYHRLNNKIDRLYKSVIKLTEYVIQVREAYHAQLDINLNSIMKFFTILSAIFMPLTLIVGWYGMNFENMPELKSSFGYLYVIGLSSITIAICLWYIKIKGYWD
ncbi:hypothetical protein AwWohl_09010 [Gammaproteobacteria bacterium]|nr:hypothetical protein AwWohl_09010 [Gammaproteobacteria bacterium]